MNYINKFAMPDVRSYAQLRTHYDATKAFRGSKDRPFGKRVYGNRRMRMLDDESIELEYMGDPLIRWHPNGTVSVKAFPSSRWGVFADKALPAGVSVAIGTRTGPITKLATTSDLRYWHERPLRSDEPPAWQGQVTVYERNWDFVVIDGSEWAHLHYYAGRWGPVDESALKPFKWYEPDRTLTRKVSAEYNIPAFLNAAKAIIALGADDVEAPRVWGRNHHLEGDRTDHVLVALKAMDFTTVMKAVRRVETRTYDPNQGSWKYEVTGISSTDIKRLRDRLYVVSGLCEVKNQRVLTLREHQRVESRLKDFGSP
jgi:hypothetical protein